MYVTDLKYVNKENYWDQSKHGVAGRRPLSEAPFDLPVVRRPYLQCSQEMRLHEIFAPLLPGASSASTRLWAPHRS